MLDEEMTLSSDTIPLPLKAYNLDMEDGNVFGLGNPSTTDGRSIWHWLAMDIQGGNAQLYPGLLLAHNKVTFNQKTIPESFTTYPTLDETTWAFAVTDSAGANTTAIVDPASETELNDFAATAIGNMIRNDTRCVFAADVSNVFQCFFASPCIQVTDFNFSLDFGGFELNEQMLMQTVYDGNNEYCQLEIEPRLGDELLLGKSFLSQSSLLLDAQEHTVSLW